MNGDRKIGPHAVIGLDGEDINVQCWDRGEAYGMTYFSALHSDFVVVTHNDIESRIHFVDTGMGVYGVPHAVVSVEAAKADVESVFINLVKRLNQTYRRMLVDQGLPAPTTTRVPVTCEERG